MFGKKITVTNCWKPVLVLCKGEPDRTLGFTDRLKGEKGAKDEHPWAQSESEARYFIDKLTRPDDLILDPMCGRGSVLHAALVLRRQAIGIEINPKYYRDFKDNDSQMNCPKSHSRTSEDPEKTMKDK